MKQGLRTAGREVAMTPRVLTPDAAAARPADPGLRIGPVGRVVRRAGADVVEVSRL